MATIRKIVFSNDQLYHVFNRGIERRDIFMDTRDYKRAINLIKYYIHKETPLRFSQLMQQPEDLRERIFEEVYKSEKLAEIISFCLMPNHFHFLLKQKVDKGVATFISNFSNAFTKYFNTKNARNGPLLQGVFKAVLVETDEQLVHLSRYIHLNPVSSSIIEDHELEFYPWSSYTEFLSSTSEKISNPGVVLSMFKSQEDYKNFVNDQIDYAKKLEIIKHLTLE